MAFIQPCFIRKNTPELRKKLEELGYFYTYYHDGNGIYCYNKTAQTFTYNNEIPKECIGIPNNNEELFLALAALRDDTNENQWFIAQDTMWDENYNGEITVYYEEGEWLMWDYYSFMEDMPSDFRKATVKEIIEHFKDK